MIVEKYDIEGENMNFIKKITMVLLIILVFFGCSSNKSKSGNDNAELIVENASEGLLFIFKDIKQDTTRMFIHLVEYPVNNSSPFSLYTDIRGAQLEQVKQTGELICPFVQNGRSYLIWANLFDKDNSDPMVLSNWAKAEITADNGIYTTNNISLKLNQPKTAATLSPEPAFSKNVQFSDPKYSYMLSVDTNDSTTSVLENAGNNLTWTFVPGASDSLSDDYDLSGNLPAYVTAYCNANYNDLLWRIGIAKTENFSITVKKKEVQPGQK